MKESEIQKLRSLRFKNWGVGDLKIEESESEI
jgi:hypothetical protein